MCKAKCPQCGFEFDVPKQTPIVNVQWTEAEDAALLRMYQNERKTVCQIAEAMNRTQDAVRNHLFKLRGAGKQKSVVVTVSMTAEEYDGMRTARERESETRSKAYRAEKKAYEIAEAASILLSRLPGEGDEVTQRTMKAAEYLKKAIKDVMRDGGNQFRFTQPEA